MIRTIYRAKLTLAATFDPADIGFVVTFPEWRYGVTQGDTESEALAMATDALVTMATDALARGEDLPAHSGDALADDERHVVLPSARRSQEIKWGVPTFADEKGGPFPCAPASVKITVE